MMRAVGSRSASRRFSTLQQKKKKNDADTVDFHEALKHQKTIEEKKEVTTTCTNQEQQHPPHRPPKTSMHHPSSSVHSASPLKRRSRKPTISSHIGSDQFSHHVGLKEAHHDLHYKQAELTRSISHRTHGIFSTKSSAAPTRNMTRRISNADFNISSFLSTKHVTWYEALSHDGPGENITPAEIHISQASVLHSETTYVRDYAKNSKELLDLHIERNQQKEVHALHDIQHQTKHMLKEIRVQGLVADTVAAIVSKKARHAVKQHLMTTTVNSGGGKLLDVHTQRRNKILADIYQRRVERRKVLDDSFGFGSQILKKMTRVLNTCTSRLAYRENLFLLAGLHSSGLHTGRTNTHQGATPLHTKITLSVDMTSDMIELHDSCYTAIVTDGGKKIQLRLDPGSTGHTDPKKRTAIDVATTVVNDIEWTVTLASDGPAMTERRSDFHPYCSHLEKELDVVHGRSKDRNNVGTESALRSMSRMLDLIHPLDGTRITGAVAKAPHKKAEILSKRCEELGFGEFNNIKKGDVRNDVIRVLEAMHRSMNYYTVFQCEFHPFVHVSAAPEAVVPVVKASTKIPISNHNHKRNNKRNNNNNIRNNNNNNNTSKSTTISEDSGTEEDEEEINSGDTISFLPPRRKSQHSRRRGGVSLPTQPKPPQLPTASRSDARGRVPWIVGLVNPIDQKNCLASFPGNDHHGFGISFLGTIHHDHETWKYCSPAVLSKCKILSLVVNLHLGTLSLMADGKTLGIAFGPGSICTNRTDQLLHSKLIRNEGKMIPSFALGRNVLSKLQTTALAAWMASDGQSGTISSGIGRQHSMSIASDSSRGSTPISFSNNGTPQRSIPSTPLEGASRSMHGGRRKSLQNNARMALDLEELLLKRSSNTTAPIKTYDLPAISCNFGAYAFEHKIKGASGFDTFLSFSEPSDVAIGHQTYHQQKRKYESSTDNQTKEMTNEKTTSLDSNEKTNENKNTENILLTSGSNNTDDLDLEELSPNEIIARDAIEGIKQKVKFYKAWEPESAHSWSSYSPVPGISHNLEVSARKLQAFCRAANGKKWRHGTRFLLYLNAIKVQRCVRRRIPRLHRKRNRATTIIQTMYRGRLGRKRMNHIREFLHTGSAWNVDGVVTGAAVLLQASYRKHVAQKKYVMMKMKQ